MISAKAFAPGHISCFFEPIYNLDLSKTGSRGAGINITLGSLSEVSIESSLNQEINIFVNDKLTIAPVTRLAIKNLIGDSPVKVDAKIKNELPLGQGFGMSAAGALSTTYALAKLSGISVENALKASHYAEVQLRTGLGDVMASSFGGVEIRKSAGLPPWGIIEHIPSRFDIVLCIIGKKISTKKVLNDPNRIAMVSEYGKYCTKKILENPSVENLLSLSQHFTKKTGLADADVQEAIEVANNYGQASMCMLGNSVFAIGKTNDLVRALSTFGRIFVCSVDNYGVRIVE